MLKCLSCSSDLTLCLLPLTQSAEELLGDQGCGSMRGAGSSGLKAWALEEMEVLGLL